MFQTPTLALLVTLVLLCSGVPSVIGDDALEGKWQLRLQHKEIVIRCGLELAKSKRQWMGTLVNGVERIPIATSVSAESIVLEIPHYDSTIRMEVVRNQEGGPSAAQGVWRKRRGPNEWVEMQAHATRPSADQRGELKVAERFAGRWQVDFSDAEDPAVGVFAVEDDGRMRGTFLTTTGDYRFLSGVAEGHRMSLSCFDGAHAFLFEARLKDNGEIEGDFWSSNTWHETFTAVRNENATLPDSFQQTLVNRNVKLSEFEFPDVNGHPVNLDAESFRGKPRLIYIFGSWCPNCHDAAAYLSTLEKTYASRGLSILGLAFELTGDFDRDAEQVKRYLARHRCDYPVLIAGTADKVKASRTFPLLDRVRSYPTTIFIDRSGKITAVHTGFSGPATGQAFETLKQRFETEIESLLD
ncbi:MAG: TlpA disulfide reductase family protein [Planctomycetota bacterium]